MSESQKSYKCTIDINTMNRNKLLGTIAVVLLIAVFSSCNSKGSANSNIDRDISKDSTRILMTSDRYQVLDVYRGSSANNAQVGLYQFLGVGNQLWYIKKIADDYVIRSYFSKKVLAVNLKDTMLVQQDYTGSDNQHWLISGETDSAVIINKALGKYLTYEKDIVFDNCERTKPQKWILQSFTKVRKEMDTCNCIENFNFVKNRIETSYSGFQDKVNLSTKAEYERLSSQSEKAAKESVSTIKCFGIIKNYLSFFHDGHIHFNTIVNRKNSDDTKGVFYKEEKIVNAKSLSLKNLDDSTLYLSLPSFAIENKSLIDDLIRENTYKIENTPYLVIDLRGNGGGDDRTFYSILPFLYTNPYRLFGVDMLASIETIKAFEAMGNRFSSPVTGKKRSQEVEWYLTLLREMKKNTGKFFVRSKDAEVRLNKVMKNPQKVAILINRNCASSAEEFLLNARESKKVQLLGEPTSGTLDYSNIIPALCPSMVFTFSYATTRSHRLPRYSIDRDKIQPNIFLTHDKDWIAEALKQLKN